MSIEKIIKRYSNRKLYDTIESRYVTLNDISDMIRNGIDVKIVDNQTNKDITSAVLAHVLLNEEKSRSSISINILKELIQSGQETIANYYRKKVLSQFKSNKSSNKNMEGDSDGSVEVISFLKASLNDFEKQFQLSINDFLNSFPAVKKIRDEMDRTNERLLRLEDRVDRLIERLEKKNQNGDN